MNAINVPIHNSWSHLIKEYHYDKQQKINAKVKEASTNMYIHILNEAIRKYGGMDTRHLKCYVTRKDNKLFIKMEPIKATLDLDYFQ